MIKKYFFVCWFFILIIGINFSSCEEFGYNLLIPEPFNNITASVNNSGLWAGNPYPSFTDGSVMFWEGNKFAEDNANLFWDAVNKRLGVRTNTPTFMVEIDGTADSESDLILIKTNNFAQFRFESYRDSSQTHGFFNARSMRGTEANPSFLRDNDMIYSIRAGSLDHNSVRIELLAEGNHGANAAGGRFELRMTPAGSIVNTRRFTVDGDGKVMFGSQTPFRQFTVKKDQDASTILMISNEDTGASAQAGFILENDIGNTFVTFFGSGHATAANKSFFKNEVGAWAYVAKPGTSIGFGLGTVIADADDLIINSDGDTNVTNDLYGGDDFHLIDDAFVGGNIQSLTGDIVINNNARGYILTSNSSNTRYGLKYGNAGSIGGSNNLMLTNREIDGSLLLGVAPNGSAASEVVLLLLNSTTRSIEIKNHTSITGNLNQTNGNTTINMIYGELWIHDGLVINLVTIDVYENLTELNSTWNNGFAYDGNGTLTARVRGVYDTSWTMSYGGSANSEYDAGVGINGNVIGMVNGQDMNKTHGHRTIGTGGQIGSMGGGGKLCILVGDEITLMMSDETAPAQDATILTMQLDLTRVGDC